MHFKHKTKPVAGLASAIRKHGKDVLFSGFSAAIAFLLASSILSAQEEWAPYSDPDVSPIPEYIPPPTNEELQDQADYYNELAEMTETILEELNEKIELLESYGEEPFTEDPSVGSMTGNEMIDFLEPYIEQLEEFQEDCLENADLMEECIDPDYGWT